MQQDRMGVLWMFSFNKAWTQTVSGRWTETKTQAWGLEPQDFPFGDSNSGVSSCFPLGQAQNSRDLYIG